MKKVLLSSVAALAVFAAAAPAFVNETQLKGGAKHSRRLRSTSNWWQVLTMLTTQSEFKMVVKLTNMLVVTRRR